MSAGRTRSWPRSLIPRLEFSASNRPGPTTPPVLRSGRRLPQTDPRTIADFRPVPRSVKSPLPILRQRVDDILTVSEELSWKPCALPGRYLAVIIEPSSAVVLSAVLTHSERFRGKRVGLTLAAEMSISTACLGWASREISQTKPDRGHRRRRLRHQRRLPPRERGPSRNCALIAGCWPAAPPFAAGQTGYLNTMTGSRRPAHRQVLIGLFRELRRPDRLSRRLPAKRQPAHRADRPLPGEMEDWADKRKDLEFPVMARSGGSGENGPNPWRWGRPRESFTFRGTVLSSPRAWRWPLPPARAISESIFRPAPAPPAWRWQTGKWGRAYGSRDDSGPMGGGGGRCLDAAICPAFGDSIKATPVRHQSFVTSPIAGERGPADRSNRRTPALRPAGKRGPPHRGLRPAPGEFQHDG